MAAVLLVASAGFGLASCKEKAVEIEESLAFPERDDLKENESGLMVLRDSGEVYTGPVQDVSSSGVLRYFIFYRDGKPHGAEMRFDKEGRLRRLNDYHDGEHVRRRDWFENGNMDMDAMLRDGIAIGRHIRWFEDGRLRFFCENFVEGLQWDGRVKDFAPDGTVIYDAIFDHGKFISGVAPSEELLERLHNMKEKEEADSVTRHTDDRQ